MVTQPSIIHTLIAKKSRDNMKQKYLIAFLQETQEVSIREYAELEKGEFALICEEVHDADVLRDAMADGVQRLVPIIRRPNMYPRQDFGEKIAQGIVDLLEDTTGETSLEIFINDADDFIPAADDFDSRVVAKADGDDK